MAESSQTIESKDLAFGPMQAVAARVTIQEKSLW